MTGVTKSPIRESRTRPKLFTVMPLESQGSGGFSVWGHGVLAPRSSWRAEVVLGRVSPTPAQLERRSEDVLSRSPSPSKAPRWTPWRELLKRSFGVDGWACPYCDQRMRLRAVVLPPATHKILRGLQAACRAPPGADAMAG